MWALLDFDNQPIRFFNFPVEGAVEIKEPEFKIDWNNFEEALL